MTEIKVKRRSNVLIFMFLQVCCLVTKTEGITGSQRRPLVIAHRGSSGILPEHTLEAYKAAVEQGADVIECDLAVTKDLQLVCSHEPWINDTTDVHTRSEFNDRVRTYFIPSELKQVTDYFTVDFTLEELKTIKRVQVRSYRDQSFNGQFPMVSFDEYIAVAKNKSNPKIVAIYPETKLPDFFNKILESNGTTMEDLLLESLEKHGYVDETSPCFVQSFLLRSLEYLSNRTKVKLVYLTGTQIPNSQLENLSSFISGIGPSKTAIVQVDPTTNKIIGTTDFLDRAHKFGFVVHPYTFRNEHQYLAYDYAGDPYREYEMFMELGVDGFFTDFPWSLSNYLALSTIEDPECPTDAATKFNISTILVTFSLFLSIFCSGFSIQREIFQPD